MTLETLRAFCKTLPHVTEDVKWGNDLCFLIGGKMFAMTCLETSPNKLSFKCSPDEFIELLERNGIVPAPYMARNHWIALERFDALRDAEIKGFIRQSYEMVKAKLPKSAWAELDKPRHH